MLLRFQSVFGLVADTEHSIRVHAVRNREQAETDHVREPAAAGQEPLEDQIADIGRGVRLGRRAQTFACSSQ